MGKDAQSKIKAPALTGAFTFFYNLSIKPSESPIFSRHYTCLIIKPYVPCPCFCPYEQKQRKLSIQMSDYFSAGNSSSAFESEILYGFEKD